MAYSPQNPYQLLLKILMRYQPDLMTPTKYLKSYRENISPVFYDSRPNNRYRHVGFMFNAPSKKDIFGYRGGLKDEIPGILDLSAFRASKKFTVDAMQERNTLAEKYTSDTKAFNESLLEQGMAQEKFASRLLEQSERLSEIREGMPSAASAASSTRLYGELAQARMQNTARYLKELEAYKAPESPEIDFSFRNPITGQKMNIDDRFEDIYVEEEPVSAVARRSILEGFASRRDAIMEEFLEDSARIYGRSSDYMEANPDGTYGIRRRNTIEEAMKDQYGPSNSFMPGYLDLGLRFRQEAEPVSPQSMQEVAETAYYNNFLNALQLEQRAESFAEAQALADMADFTEFTVNPTGRNETTFDAVTAFYEQDANKILEDMIEKTTDRLEISRLGKREDFMNEFNRRRERAVSQQDAFNRQQKENRERAEEMAKEKARVQQLFESQKREYESTMSSFGYTPDQIAGGITFDDTRPM